MSARHTKRVWNWLRQVNADPELPGSAKGAAISIADHWNERAGKAWPGTDTIATEIGRRQSTATEGVNALEGRGHLRIERGMRGRGKSHRYFPLMKHQATDISDPVKYRPADISEPVTMPIEGTDEIPL
jgi:hypothetical protein